jgi:hypothetical protein
MRIPSLLISFALLLLAPHVSRAVEPLVELKQCELEGFVAYGTAREAIVKGRKKAYWKWQPETSEFQYSFLDDLYKRVDEEAFKDHLLFGAEKLLACLGRFPANAKLPEPSRLSPCFAEMDVVLHAQQYKAGGGGLVGTKRFARNYLKNPNVYPQEMLDRVIPLAFPIDNAEKMFDLRESLLQKCIESRREQK